MIETKRGDYLEVQWLRAIAILLLVTWHCFFCTMFVWGIVEPHEGMRPFKLLSQFAIVDANMPLFTFISGYLFTALYTEKGKYRDFVPFLKNKVNRLVIPFFFFSLLIIGTSYQLNYSDIVWGEGCHLWYCAMLFWCFIIGWLVKKLDSKVLSWALFVVSTVLVFAYPNFWFLPFKLPLGLDNGIYYYSFFAMGGAFLRIVIKFYNYLKEKLFSSGCCTFSYIC